MRELLACRQQEKKFGGGSEKWSPKGARFKETCGDPLSNFFEVDYIKRGLG